jgi:hypothetical protein
MKAGLQTAAVACAFGGVLIACLHAQGRGEWTTSGNDAQRSAWASADDRLTKAAVQKGDFQFLWKQKFENDTRQLNSLTQPILLDRLIGFRGFKSLAFVGGSADGVFAIDTDLGRPYWTTHLNYSANTGGQPPSSWPCPGGLIATPTRRTAVTPSAFGGGGRGRRGVRTGSAVGEPGQGAAVLAEMAAQERAAAAAPADSRPGGEQGRGAPAADTRVAPIPFGGVDPIYAMGSDGMLHTLRASNGTDAEPPVAFLPPSANPSALIYIDGTVYTTTSNNCGGAADGVWAIDLAGDAKKVVSWKTGGGNIAGSSGAAFGTDGTLYVAVGSGHQNRPQRSRSTSGGADYADAVVALDRTTLELKDWFEAPGADFNASPILIRHKDADLVAVTGNDGRMYLLEGRSLGGPDHKTPLVMTAKFSAGGAGLATWEDQGTRWIVASAAGGLQPGIKFAANAPAPSGSVVAFKLAEENGRLTLEPGWSSRDLTSPLAPIVLNGMVFALSSGEYRGGPPALTAARRAQRSVPAVLYLLDGSTGKELWNSGKTVTSFARAGMSTGGGQVYIVTYDNHLYAFGIPMEH